MPPSTRRSEVSRKEPRGVLARVSRHAGVAAQVRLAAEDVRRVLEDSERLLPIVLGLDPVVLAGQVPMLLVLGTSARAELGRHLRSLSSAIEL